MQISPLPSCHIAFLRQFAIRVAVGVIAMAAWVWYNANKILPYQ